jgi:hypothetical protein
MCIANHGATRYRLWARMRLVYHVLCITGTLWVRLCVVYCALRIAGRMVGVFVYCVLCIAYCKSHRGQQRVTRNAYRVSRIAYRVSRNMHCVLRKCIALRHRHSWDHKSPTGCRRGKCNRQPKREMQSPAEEGRESPREHRKIVRARQTVVILHKQSAKEPGKETRWLRLHAGAIR